MASSERLSFDGCCGESFLISGIVTPSTTGSSRGQYSHYGVHCRRRKRSMQRSNPKRCRADRLEANWSKDGQAEAHRVCGSEKKDRDRSAITGEKDWSREKEEWQTPPQILYPFF